MEEKKNNKGLIWLIVILIVLVLGLVGYIVFDKVLSKDKTHINNNAPTTTTTKVSSEEKKEYIIKETKTSKAGINVTLEQKSSNDNCNLIVANNKIDLNTSYCYDYQLDLYESFIIVIFYSPLNLNIHNMFIFNYNGEQLNDASNMIIDENYYVNSTEDKFHHLYYLVNVNVDNNKIKYNINYHNDWCVLQEGYDEGLVDNCGITKISCTDLKDLGENVNYTSTYEIELIDNKFSPPKLNSLTKLKDTDVYKKAMNECE